jgi:hypothetical protein
MSRKHSKIVQPRVWQRLARGIPHRRGEQRDAGGARSASRQFSLTSRVPTRPSRAALILARGARGLPDALRTHVKPALSPAGATGGRCRYLRWQQSKGSATVVMRRLADRWVALLLPTSATRPATLWVPDTQRRLLAWRFLVEGAAA